MKTGESKRGGSMQLLLSVSWLRWHMTSCFKPAAMSPAEGAGDHDGQSPKLGARMSALPFKLLLSVYPIQPREKIFRCQADREGQPGMMVHTSNSSFGEADAGG